MVMMMMMMMMLMMIMMMMMMSKKITISSWEFILYFVYKKTSWVFLIVEAAKTLP